MQRKPATDRIGRRVVARLLAVVLVLSCGGCGDDSPKPPKSADGKAKDTAEKAHKPAATLEAVTVGDVHPLHRVGDIYLAGQPAEADLKQFADAGVATVICLRMPQELTRFNEQQVVESLGMTYHNPAFRAPETLTDPVLMRALDLLRKEQRPLLMHCASANRVGAIWLAHRVLADGVGYDDALAEARKVGLKSDPYIQIIKAYIEKTQAENP